MASNPPLVLVAVLLCTQTFYMECGCPCKNPDWCKPITDTNRKEVFVFTTGNSLKAQSRYDWTKMTTLVIDGHYSLDLMCLAHQHNTRLVLMVDYPGRDLTNATKRTAWVQQNLKTVRDHYLDGVNIDFEEPISSHRHDLITGLNRLVNETYTTFKREMPHSQVTMDTASYPRCCYDYKTLLNYVDFFVMMDYDESDSTPGPNSGFQTTRNRVKSYLSIAPPNKLVMCLPWYGDRFKCSKVTKDFHCVGEGRCSQPCFSYIYELLLQTHSVRMWNEKALSPYFTYNDTTTKQTYQIWYDDPESLMYKYNLAAKYNLRGVGVWTADCVGYQDTPLANKLRQWMWGALPRP